MYAQLTVATRDSRILHRYFNITYWYNLLADR